MKTKAVLINYFTLLFILISLSCKQNSSKQNNKQSVEYNILDFTKKFVKDESVYKLLILVNAQHCKTCQTDEVKFIFEDVAKKYNLVNIVIFDYDKHPFDIDSLEIKAKLIYLASDTAYKYNIKYPVSKFFVIKNDVVMENVSVHEENHDTILSLINKYIFKSD